MDILSLNINYYNHINFIIIKIGNFKFNDQELKIFTTNQFKFSLRLRSF